MAYHGQASVSIIIPAHKGGPDFQRCLESVLSTSPSPDEIIVVLDGVERRSLSLELREGVKVLERAVQGGPAAARNLGGTEARSDILFFVDSDVTIQENAIGKICEAFHEHPGIAAVFGSYDDEPDQPNFLSQYKNLFHHYIHQTSDWNASTFWGACGAIRKTVFLNMGGFDESYRHPSIEDVELGYRLKNAGHKIFLAKDLQVKHLKRWTITSLLRADFCYRAMPWTRLILKQNRFINDLNLKTSHRFSVGFAYALFLCTLGGTVWTPLLFVALISLLALLAFNWDLYHFFFQKRGLRFTLMALPWHWFYYLYGGMAFLLGFLLYKGMSSVPK